MFSILFLDYPHPRAEAGGGSFEEALSGKYKNKPLA
jgi:hypothetical protein